MAEAAEPTPPQSFEAALAELEGLVASLEAGQLPLEASIAAYRRGSDLLRHCQGVLSDAEQQVKVLEDGMLRDFEPEGGS